MLPSDLKPENFSAYPPEARRLIVDHLDALRRLPLSFLPNLLREVIDYDFKFPAERKDLERELTELSALSPQQIADWFQALALIKLSPELEHLDWVNSPAQFVEQLSAYLWSTRQLNAFRQAALDYADRLRAAAPLGKPEIPRLGITIIGKGVESYDGTLFRKLRPHGAYFSNVKPENGFAMLLNAATARAKAHPAPYGHWYIDGGEPEIQDGSLTCVSYAGLSSARAALLRKIQLETEKPGMGPEALRTFMAQLRPQELGFNSGSPVLDRFGLKLLTEGSGTQIFSTSFAQWAAREALRRAQPLTLLVRFAPRQRDKPMNELLSPERAPLELDPLGSLVDADMSAYYNWLNQQRLSGTESSSFLAWFENHNSAVAIGPSMPRGTQSEKAADLREILSWMS
jgi:hypothetical protein